MTERIQRKRTKGWKMPPNTVYVGRPTKWGNPFVMDGEGSDWAVKEFRVWLSRLSMRLNGVYHEERNAILNHLGYLRGKNLACWCPLDQPCHADVLLELANAPEEGK